MSGHMASERGTKFIRLALALLAVGGVLGVCALAALAYFSAEEEGGGRGGRGPRVAAVEVGTVQRGRVEDRRTFVGTLASPAEVRVAAKVGGRVEAVAVDLADEVRPGQVVARLDDAELAAEVAAAQAEVQVARANLAEAKSGAEIASRELDRTRVLQGRGVASESQYDAAQSAELAARTKVEVADAQVARAVAALDSAKVRLGYASVAVTWTPDDGDAGVRVVAERSVEEGDTIAANAPLMTIVQLDPLRAVLFVTERDYARLSPGQSVDLSTDAYPGRSFPATVDRVSPTFDETSRQARVELAVPNARRLLKPGLFVRAEATLDAAEDATTVPATALTRRGDGDAVFVLRPGEEGGEIARLVAVTLGLRAAGRVQVLTDEADALRPGDRVIVLGQQLVDDGSAVTVPETAAATTRRSAGEGGR